MASATNNKRARPRRRPSTVNAADTQHAILNCDADFRVLSGNAAAGELFGDATGKSLTALLSGLTKRTLSQTRSAVARSGSWEAELTAPPTEGQPPRVLQLVVTSTGGTDALVRGDRITEDGTRATDPAGYLVLARDVSEQRASERRLLDSQRMESVGLLAGGIAHDFNNILMGILGYASLAQDLIPAEHPARRMLTTIESSAERAASLTSQLMAYCRGGKLSSVPIDLDELLDETQNLLGSSLPAKVTIRRERELQVSNVLGDPTQLTQVFMNLCLNAAEAIVERINQQPAGKGAGEIVVSTRDVTLRKGQREVFGAENEPLHGRFVLTTVRDNGTGMDAATLRRIFEPFFTTKFTGRGLGLAAVQGIIQNHGGGLVVHSRSGHGSTFSVYLPATERFAVPMDEPVPISLEGSETVLIIDDEAVARQLGLLTLANLGYQVLLASSGAEGLETYRQYQAEIDLVLLDLTMQGMSGSEVLGELALMERVAPVLLTSGYDADTAGERAGAQYTTGFRQKPYTPEVLAKAVREILDKSK